MGRPQLEALAAFFILDRMKQSAGLLLYRKKKNIVEVLLVHPGGPYWAKKDAGVWSVPKGEIEKGEETLAAARREFAEELGAPAPEGDVVELGEARQASKIVHAWAQEAEFDADHVHSNMTTLEWPPKSGQQQEFPEVDKAAWVSLATAKTKIIKGQIPLLDRLAEHLGVTAESVEETSGQTSLF